LFRSAHLARFSDAATLLKLVWNGLLLVGVALQVVLGVRLLRSQARLGIRAGHVGALALLAAAQQAVFRLVQLGWEGKIDPDVLRYELVVGLACQGLLWWQVVRWFGELLQVYADAQIRANRA
jgi:hypothetical protein